jgi:hypothetical protein
MKIPSLITSLAIFLACLSGSINAQTTNGLQLWLKPEGLTNTVASSPISFWADSSGNGYNGFCNVAANQPAYITGGLNGLPVVRFTDDGSSSTANPNLRWIQSPLPFNATTNRFTAIVVFQAQVVGARDTLIHQANGYAILYAQSNAPSGPTNLNSNASAAIVSSGTPYAPGVWEIATVVSDNTTVSLYQNGILLGSAPVGVPVATSVGNWVFGAQASLKGNGLKGDIAEVLVYNTNLDNTTRAANENYLASKYNLPLVVLADNFNDPQTGSATPQAYSTGGGPVNIGSGAISMNDSSPSGGYDYYYATCNLNVLPYEVGAELQISFDINNLTGDYVNNQSDCWASFALSQYYPSSGGPVTDWGLLIRTNGTGLLISNPNGSLTFTPFTVTAATNYHVNLTITNGLVDAWINGNDLGASAVLCPLTYSQSFMSFGIGSDNNGAVAANIQNLAVVQTPGQAASGPVGGTLQISDTFNTADSDDLNANLARQTGLVAPVSWTTNGNLNSSVSITGNALLMTNSPGGGQAIGMAALTGDFRQFEHLNSFRIRFTVSATNDATSNDSWIAIRFRDNAPSHFVADVDGGGTGLNFFTGDGRWYLWQSFLGLTNTSGTVGSGSVPAASTYAFEFTVMTNVLKIKINGQSLLLGCGSTADAYSLTPSQVNDFITLMCFAANPTTAASAQFDNFTFESLDPGFTVAAPVISNPSYANSAFNFSLNSVNPLFYAVDTKNNLQATTWNYLGGLIGNGGALSYTNTTATNNPGFYRIRIP